MRTQYLDRSDAKSHAAPLKSNFVAINFAEIFIQSVAKLAACIVDYHAVVKLEALIDAQHDLVFADALDVDKDIALPARGHRPLVELIK